MLRNFKYIEKNTAFGLGVLYLLLETISQLFIIYILNKNYSTEFIVNWTFFFAFYPLTSLAISGYSMLITRDIAKIQPNPTKEELTRIYKSSVHLLITSGFLLLLFMLAACFYIYYKETKLIYILALLVYSFGLISRMVLQWSFSFFMGFSYFGFDKVIMIFCTLLALILVLYGAENKFNIIEITVFFVTPYILGAIYSFKNVNLLVGSKIEISKFDKNFHFNRLEIYKLIFINIAGFLTMSTDLFFAQNYFHSEMFIEYTIFSKGIIGIITLGSIYAGLHYPLYASLAKSLKYDELRSKQKSCSLRLIILSLLIGLIYLNLYPEIIYLILNQTAVISKSTIFVGLLFATVAILIINLGNAILSTGNSNLVYISISSSLLGLILAFIGAKYFSVLGLVTGMTVGVGVSALLHIKYLIYLTREIHL